MFDVKNKKRCCVILITFMLLFVILIIRLINYNYFITKDILTMSENQYQYKEKYKELNYILFDDKGRNLIKYKETYYATIDPYTYLLNNYYIKKDKLEALKIILRNYNENYDIDKTLEKDKNKKIKWTIDENTYNKIKNIKGVNGFYAYKYSCVNRKNNYWSIENLITNINKVEKDVIKRKSDDSIEMKIENKILHNEYPYSIFKKDINGDIVKEFITEPENNINIRLTLDKTIQKNIKNILNSKPFNKYEQIGVILMEADSGKVRSIVQKDDSKPNVNLGISTQNGFYAGSIFKAIVEEAGLETNTLSLNHLYNHRNFGGLFEEHEDHKNKNAEEAFVKSSNNIFVQIGNDVGIKNIHKLSEKHGFYKKVLGFDQEQKGNLELNTKSTYDDSGDSLQAYIGQKTRVTPIEAINIPNVIINKGIYIKPNIIEAYVDENNNSIEEVETEKKKLISNATADILKNQMIEVVRSKYGTGKVTRIDGIQIGGKTGTSKRIEDVYNENKKKERKEYFDGWFAGFFKVNEKYYSMVVFVQDIGKDINASGSAVPIFKKVVEENYNYLNKF